MSYAVPSSAEVSAQNQDFRPLKPEEYIVKVAKIWLEKVPTWVQGRPDYNNLVIGYKTICLPYALRSGAPMRDTDGKEVAPLTAWQYRDFNPLSIGSYQGRPSMMRQVAAYLQGVDNAESNFSVPDFVLIDANHNPIKDDDERAAYLNNPQVGRGKGQRDVWDIRSLEGGYIGCSIELNEKGYNKITRFAPLPENFQVPTPEQEAEAMAKFEEGYQKFLANKAERDAERKATAQSVQAAPQQYASQTTAAPAPQAGSFTNPEADVVDDELMMDDIPF